MIDAVTGDPVQITSMGGELNLAVVHDKADDGNDVTEVHLSELSDVVEVLMTAAAAVRHRLQVAAELARAAGEHELNQPEKGWTPARLRLLCERLAGSQAELADARVSISRVLEHDRHWAGVRAWQEAVEV